MLYQEFLNHIFNKYSGNVKLELTRMQNLLEAMGNPQNSLRGLHIAGTNGKGSVCATLEALALAHNLTVGLNTSPHLINYTERFRINGKDLPFETILDIYLRYENLFEKYEASFFEITTAIAFQAFKEAKLNTVIIEVGLGGRLDATNLFTPDITAITTIGLDHIKTLGGTLEQIATEKAGIIKENVPLVLGNIAESPLNIIIEKAEKLNAPVYLPQKDYFYQLNQIDLNGLQFDYSFGPYTFQNLNTNLLGEHQAANVAQALTAFILYSEKRGFSISPPKIYSALQNIHWQGRMQVLSSSPIIIADGAHNVHGVQALISSLHNLFPGRKFRFLVSILADKNYKEMLALICANAEKIYIAQNESDRAATVEMQSAEISKYEIPYETASTVPEAFIKAINELSKNDILICCGSLYTVGEILNYYQQSDNFIKQAG